MTRYNQLLASYWFGHPQMYQLLTLAIGSSSSFRFSEIQDMSIVPIDAILVLADPRARRDYIFTSSQRKKLQLLLNILNFLLSILAMIKTTVLILLVFAIFLL